MIARFSSSRSQWSRGTRALCSLALPYRLRQSNYLPRATPIHAMKRSAAISVFLDHARTKSTTASRVRGERQVLGDECVECVPGGECATAMASGAGELL